MLVIGFLNLMFFYYKEKVEGLDDFVFLKILIKKFLVDEMILVSYFLFVVGVFLRLFF